MRIAIIAFNNPYKCPYIEPYKNILEELNIDYDIIYFNRINEVNNKKNYIGIEYNSHKNKLSNFLTFRKALINLLNLNRYTKLIILTTMPSILISSYLIKEYKNNYLLDIRDYTYEKYSLYRMLEKKVIMNTEYCVISSPGFKKFLPDHDYVMCHNVSKNHKPYEYTIMKSEKEICIGYIGSLAYIEQCKKLIELVISDIRFTFHFYGDEAVKNTLFPYIDSLNNMRIRYFGGYAPDEKVKIIKKVDILFNAYGNESLLLTTALSNKLYDSLYLKKPLLTSPNTMMKEETGCFSYAFDFDKNCNLDSLYNWYTCINEKEFNKFCNQYLTEVLVEQDKYKANIVKFANGE